MKLKLYAFQNINNKTAQIQWNHNKTIAFGDMTRDV
jgi:hypothetical protein